MIVPPFLQPGDTVGIVATGRKVSRQDLEAPLSIVKSWGLQVRLAENLFSQDHPYLAGTDAQRLADFQSMIDDPSIKAILCARGGYGSTRIVDRIDFSALKKNSKWIAGFSDVTAIHLKLFRLGIQSIHGTMPILFSKPDASPSVESLKRALFEGAGEIQAAGYTLNKTGTGHGQLIGGNLSLLADSLGTSAEPDTAGKILVIEEIDEYRYKTDRMLTQLRRAGKLDRLAGLVAGHMTDMLDTALSFGEALEEIISHHTKDFNYPVAFRFPSGHENPNLAWTHGATATLQVTAQHTSLVYR